MINILNIIIIIKHIQSLLNICDVLLICQFDICLRDHCNLCTCHWNSSFFKSLTYSTEIFRCCKDLEAVFFL